MYTVNAKESGEFIGVVGIDINVMKIQETFLEHDVSLSF